MPEEHQEWIAVYTKPRFERIVVHQLEQKGLICYLPLRPSLRQWSDRKRWIEEPLIPSYVFVLLNKKEVHRVYQTNGLVRVIMFHGQVAVIQPTEIELLRRATDSPDVELLPDNQYHSGEEILINDGLFAGYQGTVVHTKEHSRVAVRIHELGLSLVVTVPRLQVCAVALHETE